MSSKSSIISILFVLVGTLLVCAYCAGMFVPMEQQLHLPGTALPMPMDAVVAVVVLLLALLAMGLGGSMPVIVIMGSLGIFMALTFDQSEPIKYMTLAALLFCVGFYGMVVSRNAVRVLMSIELMLNAVNINLVALSRSVDAGDLRGQVFAIFILTVAAAEAAVGLAIVLAIYRNMSTVDMEKFNLLKW